MYVNELFKNLVNWSAVLYYMQCTEFTEFSLMSNWTLSNDFQTQVLHFSYVTLSKHIHCILFFFSFSHKGGSPAIPQLPLRRVCWNAFYFPIFIIWTVFYLMWPYSDNYGTRVSYSWHSYNMILLQAPERPLLKYFYQVVRAEIIAKASLEFFSCLYQNYLISENCISTHWEILFRELIRLYHESPALNFSFIFWNWAL